jgi:hypothetical protein
MIEEWDRNQMSSDQRFILLYATNLMLTSQDFEALKCIEEYGLMFKKEKLLQANMNKILSLIMMKEKNFKDAYYHLEQARILFTDLKSTLGKT